MEPAVRLSPLAVILALSLPASGALAQDVPAALLGRWVGTGTETDGTTWPMELDLRADGASVWYPSFPCAARWLLDRALGGATVTGVESLTAGIDLCADNLALQLRAGDKGGLIVEWYDANAAAVARAELDRP